MTTINNIGKPIDWKVNNRTKITNKADKILINKLSFENDEARSHELVEFPTK